MKDYDNLRVSSREDYSGKKGVFFFNELGFGWVVDVSIIRKINPSSKGKDISEKILRYLLE